MTQIRHIPSGEITELWGEIEPLARQFCENSLGCYKVEDVLMALVTGKWDLWGACEAGRSLDSILLGMVVVYPRRRVYECFGLVGMEPRRFVALYPEFDAWAHTERNCSLVIATTPKGWERLLAPQGFTKSHVVLAKEAA